MDFFSASIVAVTLYHSYIHLCEDLIQNIEIFSHCKNSTTNGLLHVPDPMVKEVHFPESLKTSVSSSNFEELMNAQHVQYDTSKSSNSPMISQETRDIETFSVASSFAQLKPLRSSNNSLHNTPPKQRFTSHLTRQKSLATSKILHDIAQDILEKAPYNPSPYCIFDHKGQLQTAFQYFIRNLTRLIMHVIPFSDKFVHYKRECIVLPDGGTVAIDWAQLGSNLTDAALHIFPLF